MRKRKQESTGYIDVNGNMIYEGCILYCTPPQYLCPIMVEVFWGDDDIWGTDWVFCSPDAGPLTWSEIKDGKPEIMF